MLWIGAGIAAIATGFLLSVRGLRFWTGERNRWLRRAFICNPCLSAVFGGLSMLAASFKHGDATTAMGLVAIALFATGVLFTVAHGVTEKSRDPT